MSNTKLPKARNLGGFLYGATNLETLNLSGADFSGVTDINSGFSYSKGLKH